MTNATKPLAVSLLTETEYVDALSRIDALMGAETGSFEATELDTLVNRVVMFEALDAAADALVLNMLAVSAVRRDKKLAAVYRKRAEIAVCAWLADMASQGITLRVTRAALAKAAPEKETE